MILLKNNTVPLGGKQNGRLFRRHGILGVGIGGPVLCFFSVHPKL